MVMTHDELLAKVKQIEQFSSYDPFQNAITALRAVVELHKPTETTPPACRHCDGISNEYSYSYDYPCPTIQAVEKELV